MWHGGVALTKWASGYIGHLIAVLPSLKTNDLL